MKLLVKKNVTKAQKVAVILVKKSSSVFVNLRLFQHDDRGSCMSYKLLVHDFSQISCKVFSEPEILKSLYKSKN